MSSNLLHLNLIKCFVTVFLPVLISCSCPRETGEFHRLGKTRFYIYDKGDEPERYMDVNWHEAQEKCTSHAENFHLASSIDKVSTNAIIARNLEVLAQRLDLKETVYWVDAIYNKNTDTYRWSNVSNIRYGNFFYQQPHPVGLLGHMKQNIHNKRKRRTEDNSLISDQCIAYALPFHNNPLFGWQASWVEKDCTDRDHRRALCESLNPSCKSDDSRNPHILTEDKEYYFTEGNWIFANRRFIVNWKPRTKSESEEYCKKYDLEVFTPVLDDNCLIPYLKLWAPVISTYHFWTSYSYHSDESVYRDKNGKIQKSPKQIDRYHNMGRSHAYDKQHCVTYQWSFELINQTRCNCDWMYYVLVPAKCENYVGTICQHKTENNRRTCDFQREWLQDFSQALETTAVVEFGYKGSGFWRSTYKQTFGSRICGDRDRQMIDYTVEYWSVNPSAVEYTYDYEETYWVVDENLFRHAGKDLELCSVSIGSYDKIQNVFTRELRKVNCNEWHFYLCELVF